MGRERTTRCNDRRCLVHSVPEQIRTALIKRAFEKMIAKSFTADEIVELWRLSDGT